MTEPVTLPEPIAFKFFRNRRKDVVAVTISTFHPKNRDPRNVIDVRLFAMNPQGINVPTKHGITMDIARLIDLHKSISKALKKAKELGLIDDEAERC